MKDGKHSNYVKHLSSNSILISLTPRLNIYFWIGWLQNPNININEIDYLLSLEPIHAKITNDEYLCILISLYSSPIHWDFKWKEKLSKRFEFHKFPVFSEQIVETEYKLLDILTSPDNMNNVSEEIWRRIFLFRSLDIRNEKELKEKYDKYLEECKYYFNIGKCKTHGSNIFKSISELNISIFCTDYILFQKWCLKHEKQTISKGSWDLWEFPGINNNNEKFIKIPDYIWLKPFMQNHDCVNGYIQSFLQGNFKDEESCFISRFLKTTEDESSWLISSLILQLWISKLSSPFIELIIPFIIQRLISSMDSTRLKSRFIYKRICYSYLEFFKAKNIDTFPVILDSFLPMPNTMYSFPHIHHNTNTIITCRVCKFTSKSLSVFSSVVIMHLLKYTGEPNHDILKYFQDLKWNNSIHYFASMEFLFLSSNELFVYFLLQLGSKFISSKDLNKILSLPYLFENDISKFFFNCYTSLRLNGRNNESPKYLLDWSSSKNIYLIEKHLFLGPQSSFLNDDIISNTKKPLRLYFNTFGISSSFLRLLNKDYMDYHIEQTLQFILKEIINSLNIFHYKDYEKLLSLYSALKRKNDELLFLLIKNKIDTFFKYNPSKKIEYSKNNFKTFKKDFIKLRK
jgi:hypothetical protein